VALLDCVVGPLSTRIGIVPRRSAIVLVGGSFASSMGPAAGRWVVLRAVGLFSMSLGDSLHHCAVRCANVLLATSLGAPRHRWAVLCRQAVLHITGSPALSLGVSPHHWPLRRVVGAVFCVVGMFAAPLGCSRRC